MLPQVVDTIGSRVSDPNYHAMTFQYNKRSIPVMRITNTLTGEKEEFIPSVLPVRIYVCGLTPKDEPHLGHARLFVATDVIRRYLEYRGYPVKYVQNFTDIDDKIIQASRREGIPPSEAAKRYTAGYFRDMNALAIRPADVYTYVTEFMPQIIAFVQKLVEKEHAYVLEGEGDRDVYFATNSFPSYGKLSKRNKEAMEAGARIELDERKRDPRDFALWKAAKPGEPWWDSPWGHGRPGWHIECSTMAMETLGEQIDIHGGGADLIFPHHENEIAQSEGLTGKPFARYWVHTGLLQMGDEKMAHSSHFVTTKSVLEVTPAPALRLYLLSQSYRTPFTYLPEQVTASVKRWHRWAEARQTAAKFVSETPAPEKMPEEFKRYREEFITAMDDDFNTSGGMAVIDALVRRLNEMTSQSVKGKGREQRELIHASLAILDELLGILGISLDLALDIRRSIDDVTRAEIEALIAARTEARKAKDWQESDRIRKELDERFKVLVKDGPTGSTWEAR
jgi:cysteinyl-tRNA synthetase